LIIGTFIHGICQEDFFKGFLQNISHKGTESTEDTEKRKMKRRRMKKGSRGGASNLRFADAEDGA